MAVKFVDGDIFETAAEVILAHGCNCAGAMGKGIAVEFKRRWPQMYVEYKEKCAAKEFGCGDVFVWDDENSGRLIFNLGTQKTWRTKATFEAIKSSLEKVVTLAEESKCKTVCMPMIGAGLGGLSSEDVKKLLHEMLSHSSVLYVVCENYIQGKSPVSNDSNSSMTS